MPKAQGEGSRGLLRARCGGSASTGLIESTATSSFSIPASSISVDLRALNNCEDAASPSVGSGNLGEVPPAIGGRTRKKVVRRSTAG